MNERIIDLETELTAALSANEALKRERDEARKERDEFQAELQKVCDHEWEHIGCVEIRDAVADALAKTP